MGEKNEEEKGIFLIYSYLQNIFKIRFIVFVFLVLISLLL